MSVHDGRGWVASHTVCTYVLVHSASRRTRGALVILMAGAHISFMLVMMMVVWVMMLAYRTCTF